MVVGNYIMGDSRQVNKRSTEPNGKLVCSKLIRIAHHLWLSRMKSNQSTDVSVIYNVQKCKQKVFDFDVDGK